MRQSLISALAATGAVVVVAFAGLPALAADTTSLGGNDLTVTREKTPADTKPPQDARATPAPMPDRQHEANAVKSMAGQVQSGVAGVHPGEDSLGTGTSITH